MILGDFLYCKPIRKNFIIALCSCFLSQGKDIKIDKRVFVHYISYYVTVRVLVYLWGFKWLSMSLHRTKNMEQRTLCSISCRADMLPTNFLNLYPNNHLPPQAASMFNNCLWLLSTNVLKENAVHSRQLLLVFFLLIPYLFPITKDNRNDFQN